MYRISASILSVDPLMLFSVLDEASQAGIQTIHLDVMDNHYVPNLSFGPNLCHSIRQHFPQLRLDVHLMTQGVDALIPQFADAGADHISLHSDSTTHLDRSLQLIANVGLTAGLAINPAQPLTCIEYCQHMITHILIMTVNPGFAAQPFIESMYPKVADAHQRYPTHTIQVDGGVTAENIASLHELGASDFVVGSNLFNQESIEVSVHKLHDALSSIP